MPEALQIPPGVDPTTPSPARMYDYYLGGTHNLPVDRDLADKLMAVSPDVVDGAFANRGFHGRAAVWMAGHGIRQFIDIGSGLPTQSNTHDAVRQLAPNARVAYIDNDPAVAAYGQALIAGDGSTTVIMADMREPDFLLDQPGLRALIDFREPVGVLMTAVTHFLADSSDPRGLVARYMAAVAPGSYLALSHATYDKMMPSVVEFSQDVYARTTASIYLRSKTEVERFFDGLELVTPDDSGPGALTYAGVWGAEDPVAADSDGSRAIYCAVARRP
jgi:hypothetical protein